MGFPGRGSNTLPMLSGDARLPLLTQIGDTLPGENLSVIAAAGASQTLNLKQSTTFDITGSASTSLLTPSVSSPVAGQAYSATILLRQDSSGNRAWTFPVSVKWGSTPLFSTVPNAVDTVTMVTTDGGTTFLAYGPTATAVVNQRDAEGFLGWRPTTPAIYAENYPRVLTMAGGSGVPISGTLNVFLGPKLYAGDVVSTFTTIVGSPGSTALTHSWFCLIDPSNLGVICKTADDTAVWNAFGPRSVSMGTPFTVVTTKVYYVGLVLVATTTVPQLRGLGGSISEAAEAMVPSINATSTVGLSDPTSLGATATALASPTVGTFVPWVGIS